MASYMRLFSILSMLRNMKSRHKFILSVINCIVVLLIAAANKWSLLTIILVCGFQIILLPGEFWFLLTRKDD